MKILFLSHQWTHNSHHSLHSGFQRLVHFAAADHEVTLVTWADRELDYMDGPIRVITVRSGRRDFLFSRRIAISRKGASLAPSFDAVHSIVSDCTYHLPRNGFTMTLHLLPDVVKYKEFRHRLFLFLKYHILQRKAFRNAASIACVSTNLLEAIPAQYRTKARFIPHGADTDFWDPALASPAEALAKAGSNYILCVGAHGLDRQLLSDFIRANLTRQFIIVGLKQQLEASPNTQYLYNISDEDLRDLYFAAGLMFRPLLFSTANNSILEALAMGTTILASRIRGVTDYLTPDSCVFVDTLRDQSLEQFQTLRLDPVHIRQSAIDTFSWNKVIDTEYVALYNQ